MRVLAHRQAEVPRDLFAGEAGRVLAPSHQLDHEQRQIGKPQGIGGAALDQEVVQRAGVGLRGQRLAQIVRDVHDPRPALRRPHHAAHDREAPPLQESCDRPVRRDHEVLDDLACPVAPLGGEPAHRVAVELGLHLDRLELERSLLMAIGLEPLGHAILKSQVVGQAGDGADGRRHRALALEPRAYAPVRELGAIAHHRPVHVGALAPALAVDRDLDHDRQPVRLLHERCEVGAQALRKHGEDLGRCVDRGGVGPGVIVHRGAGLDERRDIRHRHPDPGRAVCKRLRHGELIQVARVVVVDRAPQEAA